MDLAYVYLNRLATDGSNLGTDLLGAKTGIHLTWPQDRIKSHFFAEIRGFVVGDRSLWLRTGSEQRLALSRNTAVHLGASYNRVEGTGYLQAELSLRVHF